VDKHIGKSGTPTMGGIIFVFACIIASSIFLRGEVRDAILILLTMIGYGFLGFLDDFIKIKYHKNEGLKPYQKLIGQIGLALIISIFAYFKFGSEMNFFGLKFDFGLFFIPFVVIFYVAVTNAVNLIDGLDGLAGGVSMTYLLFFGAILVTLGNFYNYSIIAFAMAGALLGFLLFNGFPAKIFMGDTGSLALGGLIASLAVFSGLEFIMPIIGIMYVLTALSDILQVAYYKKTHKRILLMAPLHHHFEKKGVHENRIVLVYIVITMLCGIGTLLLYMAVMGVI
jgi:phospho-N-acetylmuramoyl-pentapeptide-transferase